MREAVIVSTARTPIGKAYRGAFNKTQAPGIGGPCVAEAVRRAGVDPAEIEDVVMGCGVAAGLDRLQHRAPGRDPRRASRSRSPGMTIDRQCASGLMAIATAAKRDRAWTACRSRSAAASSRSRSCRTTKRNEYRRADPWLVEHRPELYMTMIETAEIVAERYQVTRERAGRIRALDPDAHRRGANRPAASTPRSCRCRR